MKLPKIPVRYHALSAALILGTAAVLQACTESEAEKQRRALQERMEQAAEERKRVDEQMQSDYSVSDNLEYKKPEPAK